MPNLMSKLGVLTGAVDLLKRARQLLITADWGQGSSYSGGRYCSTGAIQYAAYEMNWQPDDFVAIVNKACLLLCNAIGREATPYEQPASLIVGWNDYSWRKKAEVLAAFDRAVKLGTTELEAMVPNPVQELVSA